MLTAIEFTLMATIRSSAMPVGTRALTRSLSGSLRRTITPQQVCATLGRLHDKGYVLKVRRARGPMEGGPPARLYRLTPEGDERVEDMREILAPFVAPDRRGRPRPAGRGGNAAGAVARRDEPNSTTMGG